MITAKSCAGRLRGFSPGGEVVVELQDAIVQNNLGVSRQRAGAFVEADLAYKESLRILESLYGPKHPAVAQSLSNRAALYREIGEFSSTFFKSPAAFGMTRDGRPKAAAKWNGRSFPSAIA